MTDTPGSQPPPPDPTTAWGAPPPEPSEPPEPPDDPAGSSSSDGSRRGLLIGAGILALVAAAVAAFLLLGDDDDDQSVETRLAAQIQSESNGSISDDDAECLADRIVNEIGEDELSDVDFSADAPPAELADDLGTAMLGALDDCEVAVSSLDPSDDDTEDPQDTDSGDEGTDGIDIDDIDDFDADEMRDSLADIYEDSMGLDREQAECLAGKLAELMESGDLSQDEAMSDVFSFLQDCDISIDELGTPSG